MFQICFFVGVRGETDVLSRIVVVVAVVAAVATTKDVEHGLYSRNCISTWACLTTSLTTSGLVNMCFFVSGR